MKHELILAGLRGSWGVIRMGQRITRLADRWEETVRVPFSLHHRCVLAILRFGGRIETIGEALEARVDKAAQSRGCDMEYLMGQMITAHTNAGR